MTKDNFMLIIAILISVSSYSQNTREILERNKVEHITITTWQKESDGTEKRSGDMMRIENSYDLNGNLTDNLSFITYLEEKHERITYKYDNLHRPTEIIIYEFNDIYTEGYVIKKQIQKYDEKDNLIFYSLENNSQNPKIVCEYLYQHNETDKLIKKTTKCTDSKGESEQTVIYVYDKKGNLVLEDNSIFSDIKYDLKYYNKSNKIQERINYSTYKQEFFDENGNLTKIVEPSINTFFKYDEKRNIIEKIEDYWQSSVTGPTYYTFIYDNENRLMEKTGKTENGDIQSIEKWTYDEKGLLIEYIDDSESEKYEYRFYK